MVLTIKRGAEKSEVQQLLKKLATLKKRRGIDSYKYCGILKLKEDPKVIQKKLRSEWD